VPLTELLLAYDADPAQLCPGDGQTPLHQAVSIPSDAIVHLLLERKPTTTVDAPNSHGHTPLDHAIMLGYASTARIILAAGAQINVSDSHGDTVLHRAVRFCPRRGSMIRLLVEAGADFSDAKNARGLTVLEVADAMGYTWVLDACKEFVNSRTPVDAKL
jgi:ankyrin repeat protein